MFVRKHAIVEPMYLDKDFNGKEVFVPGQYAVKLRQLERDGLRFLYRHFKKKSHGAIMNDPPSHGKIVQEVLLLQSLQSQLESNNPCLVITNATNIKAWKYVFSLFYENYEKYVIFEPKSVFEDKRIFVCSQLTINYNQRKWRIAIIDDSDSTNDPPTYIHELKLLNADFIIWNSSLKIYEEINKLKIIYNYIYKDFLDTKYLTTIGYAHMMNIIGEFCLTRDTPGAEAKGVCRDRDKWHSVVSTYLEEINKLKIIYNYIYKDFLDTKYLTTIGYAHMMNIIGEFCLTRDTPGHDGHMMLDLNQDFPAVKTNKVSLKNKDSTGTKVKSTKRRRLDSENEAETAIIKDLVSSESVPQMIQHNGSNNLIPQQNICDKAKEVSSCNFMLNYEDRYSNDKKLHTFYVFIHTVKKTHNEIIKSQDVRSIKVNESCTTSHKNIDAEHNFGFDKKHLITPLKLEMDTPVHQSKENIEIGIVKDLSENSIENEDDLMVPLNLEIDSDVTNSGDEINQNDNSIENKTKTNYSFKNSYENTIKTAIEKHALNKSSELKYNMKILDSEAINSEDKVDQNKSRDKTEKYYELENNYLNENKNKTTIEKEYNNECNIDNKIEINNDNKLISNKDTKDSTSANKKTMFEDDDDEIIGDKSMYEKILNQFF